MTETTREKAKAQAEYCNKRGVPVFAPSSGRCFKCGMDIYENMTVEQAGSRYMTGCPICHRSFCG